MGFLSYFLLGAGLSMDALAVAVSAGIGTPGIKKPDALRIALCFGGFQALMPVLGWLLGSSVAYYIAAYDHWAAFGLLTFIGVKMIVDARGEKRAANLVSGRTLLVMAVATSVDALAAGVTLGLVNASIAVGAAIIGLTTFALSFAGVLFGSRLGAAFEKWASVTGGLVLAGIGVKILVEHLLG
jgi:putative Mn2+ efflux pump MntP